MSRTAVSARRRDVRAAAAIALASHLVSCAGAAPAPHAAPPAARTYRNPVIAVNCPDPGVLEVAGVFYAACTTNTNDTPDKFPIYRSPDLVHWTAVGHIFPRDRTPAWARADYWAPEIHRVGAQYVAYFTARDADGRLAIGVARSDRVEGPFTDAGQPLVHDARAGMIDPHYFADQDGRGYLYWKIDGNAFEPPEPTNVYVQPVAPDGLSLSGERTAVLTNDQPWEGEVIEGGWVVHRGEYYYLFYSGNAFNSDRYATGVARARSPRGPFEKRPGGPILHSSARWLGPGHGSVVSARGRDWYVYHAWEPGRVDPAWDRPLYPRMMLIDPIEWRDGWPAINDGQPSDTVRPAPGG